MLAIVFSGPTEQNTSLTFAEDLSCRHNQPLHVILVKVHESSLFITVSFRWGNFLGMV
jgi:hypothetical protein